MEIFFSYFEEDHTRKSIWQYKLILKSLKTTGYKNVRWMGKGRHIWEEVGEGGEHDQNTLHETIRALMKSIGRPCSVQQVDFTNERYIYMKIYTIKPSIL